MRKRTPSVLKKVGDKFSKIVKPNLMLNLGQNKPPQYNKRDGELYMSSEARDFSTNSAILALSDILLSKA
jgi:hypothetical protein